VEFPGLQEETTMNIVKRSLVIEVPEDVDEVVLEHPSGETEAIPVDFEDDDEDEAADE
jgi:hypothetical protein